MLSHTKKIWLSLAHGLALYSCGALASGPISSFTIINSVSDLDISTSLTGGIVNLTETPKINIRANCTTDVQSVVFEGIAGNRVESGLPYSYKGDSNSNYADWAPSAGVYNIKASAYSLVKGQGVKLGEATFTLTVQSGVSVTPTATPTSTPIPTPTSTRIPTPIPTPTSTRIPTPIPTPSGAYSGHLIIDPNSVHHFVYDRDDNGDNERDVAYLAGSGGPEGFLYESQARRTEIIDKLLNSTKDINLGPVNGIYFHSIRSFGGDAKDNTQTPFVNNSDPYSGLSPLKIDSWRADLERLDNAGVILWFTLFDDHAAPYGCQFNNDYKKYAVDIANEFKHLKNLIWVTQEEYRWTNNVGGSSTLCPAEDSAARQKGLAAAIRSVDPIHPIATHHMNGSGFEFENDPTIKVFGQQSKQNTPQLMHDSSGKRGWGNHVYVMAEANTWHKDLLNLSGGAGRTLMRQSNWATAMSGGYVMMYAAFETAVDPSIDILDDLRRLRNFMESTAFNKLSPLFDTALQQAKLAGTNYILANQSQGMYLLYGYASDAQLGINNITSGNYKLRWLDVITGDVVEEQQSVSASSAVFTKPSGFSNEAALYLVKQP